MSNTDPDPNNGTNNTNQPAAQGTGTAVTDPTDPEGRLHRSGITTGPAPNPNAQAPNTTNQQQGQNNAGNTQEEALAVNTAGAEPEADEDGDVFVDSRTGEQPVHTEADEALARQEATSTANQGPQVTNTPTPPPPRPRVHIPTPLAARGLTPGVAPLPPSSLSSPYATAPQGFQPPYYVFQQNPKIDKLEDLEPLNVRSFIHQIEVARTEGQPVRVPKYLKGKALQMLQAKKVNCTIDSMVLAALRDILEEDSKTLLNKPTLIVKDQLTWDTSTTLSVEKKCRKFFDDLELLTKESRAAGVLAHGLTKERVIVAAVKKLPKELCILPDDVRDDHSLLEITALRKHVESRLDMLRNARFHKQQQNYRRANQNTVDNFTEPYSPTYAYDAERTNYNYTPTDSYAQHQDIPSYGSYAQDPVESPSKTYSIAWLREFLQPEYEPPMVCAVNAEPRRMNSPQCWNCHQYGHVAAECTLPPQPRLKENIEAFRRYNARRPRQTYQPREAPREEPPQQPQPPPPQEPQHQPQPQQQRKPRILALDSGNKEEARLEIYGHQSWTPVAGCLDSGSDGNVAPESLKHFARDLRPITDNIYYRLPNQIRLQPIATGVMSIRVNYRGSLYNLGTLPFDFMPSNLNWTQVLIGRPALRKHKLLPENNVPKNLNKIEDPHAAPQPANEK